MRRARTQQVGNEEVYLDSRIDACQKGMLRFDLYKQPFRLLLPDGKNEYRTFAGAILSLVTIGIVISYGSNKVTRLYSRSDFKIQRYVEEFLFEKTIPLNQTQSGFAVAYSITGVEGTAGPQAIPPEIGALRMYHKYYDPEVWPTFTPVESRPCTDEDFRFGLNDTDKPDALFYPTINSLGDL